VAASRDTASTSTVRALLARSFGHLDLDGLDGHRLVGGHEAELRLVRRLELGAGGLRVAVPGHGQRRVGARVAQVKPRDGGGGGHVNALFAQLRLDGAGELRPEPRHVLRALLAQRLDQRLLAAGRDGRPTDAIGRQEARKRMDQHRLHAERVGHQAGMLPRRATEGVQEILRHVIAALDADLLDRVRHVLDRDGEEALGHLLGRLALGLGDLGELLADDLVVERLVLAGAEDAGKELRPQLAEHDVGIRHRQRPAAPVAGGAGIGAGAVGTGAEAAGIGVQDRAAARRHGVNAHHRRTDTDARDLGVEGALVVAREMRDVRRCAAHVEADDAGEPGIGRRLDHADDAACRPRQDRVLALELLGRRHAARGHHELERRAGFARRRRAERTRDARHVAPEDRGEVGVHHRRVAAPHELHKRADLVADRDLPEAHGAHHRGKLGLVGRVLPGVHEDDGDRVDPVGLGLFQSLASRLGVERKLHAAVCHQPLAHLDHALVKLLGQDDLLGEDVGPGLIGDAERVAEPLRDEEEGAVPLPLQQRVGGHRRSHLHRADDARVDLAAEKAPYALDRSVLVGLGVLGQELQGVQRAVRRPADYVREGAAPVDPEIPELRRGCVGHVGLPDAAARSPGSREGGQEPSSAFQLHFVDKLSVRGQARFTPGQERARNATR
jgi:hypothetical protein